MSRKFYEKQDNTSEKSEFPHTRRQFPVDRKLGYRTGGAGAPGWGKVCFPTLLKKCEKALDKRRKEWYNRRVVERPFGQAAKTPPSHGGNGGSIPPGVTRIQRNRIWHPLGACPVFCCKNGEDRRQEKQQNRPAPSLPYVCTRGGNMTLSAAKRCCFFDIGNVTIGYPPGISVSHGSDHDI